MKRISFIGFFLIIVVMILSHNVYAVNYPQIDSRIVEIYDLTEDKLLYTRDENEKTPIASITKIATAITAIENIDNVEQKVTVTEDILNTVNSEASVAGLETGDVVTYRDLLYAILVPSGADAAHAIAIVNSGNMENFVAKMNAMAQKVGLTNTHFMNVTGLESEGHYSTADDVRKLLVYALKNPLFRQIYTTKEYQLSNGLLIKSTLYKYNISPSDIGKIVGSKTGFFEKLGYCMTSLSNIHGHEIIIVTIGAKREGEDYYNIIDTIQLIDFLNAYYHEQVLIPNGYLVRTIPVLYSNIDSYDVISKSNVTQYLLDDFDSNKIKIDYEGLEKLDYHNEKGEKIGTVYYYDDNQLIGSEDVLLDQDIHFNFWKVMKNYFWGILRNHRGIDCWNGDKAKKIKERKKKHVNHHAVCHYFFS